MSGSSSHSRSPSRRNWKEFRERFDHKRIRSLKKTSQDTIVHDEDSSTRQSTSTSKGSHKFYPTHRYEDHGFSRLSTRYQPPSTSTLRKESKERIIDECGTRNYHRIGPLQTASQNDSSHADKSAHWTQQSNRECNNSTSIEIQRDCNHQQFNDYRVVYASFVKVTNDPRDWYHNTAHVQWTTCTTTQYSSSFVFYTNGSSNHNVRLHNLRSNAGKPRGRDSKG